MCAALQCSCCDGKSHSKALEDAGLIQIREQRRAYLQVQQLLRIWLCNSNKVVVGVQGFANAFQGGEGPQDKGESGRESTRHVKAVSSDTSQLTVCRYALSAWDEAHPSLYMRANKETGTACVTKDSLLSRSCTECAAITCACMQR